MPFGLRTAAQSRDDVQALAGRLGYVYSPSDPGDVLGLDFRLFGPHGADRRVRDFVSGQHAGQSAQLFILDIKGERTSHRGDGISASAVLPSELVCGLVGIPAEFPPTSISRRIGSSVVMHDTDEMQFESAAFNQSFRVHSASEKAAFSLIDGRMMEWLATQPIPFLVIELSGPWWFVAMPSITPSGWPVMLSLYDIFGSYVPPVALSTFPRRST